MVSLPRRVFSPEVILTSTRRGVSLGVQMFWGGCLEGNLRLGNNAFVGSSQPNSNQLFVSIRPMIPLFTIFMLRLDMPNNTKLLGYYSCPSDQYATA